MPRVIHQIWLQGEPPRVYQELSAILRRHHPRWEYVLWSKASWGELINEQQYAQACAQGHFSVACDIMRYEVLAQRGGLYLDLDFYVLRSLDELFGHASLVFAVEGYRWITNALIAARPNHPFIWKLVRGLPGRCAAVEAEGQNPIDRTGPRYVTDLLEGAHTDVALIPEAYLFRYRGEEICEAGYTPRSFEYGVHLWGHQGSEKVADRKRALDKHYEH